MDYQNMSSFPSHVYLSTMYRETMLQDQHRIEPSCSDGTATKPLMSAYLSCPAENERQLLTGGVKGEAMSVPSTVSYMSSNCQLEDNTTMSSLLDSQQGCPYDPEAFEDLGCKIEDCSHHEKVMGDTSASVLRQLDDILRKKIHLELEDFKTTLHEVFDGHMEHIYHLFNLCQPTDTEMFCASQDNTRSGPQLGEDQEIKHSRFMFEEDMLCYQSLVSLFISAATINEALRIKIPFFT